MEEWSIRERVEKIHPFILNNIEEITKKGLKSTWERIYNNKIDEGTIVDLIENQWNKQIINTLGKHRIKDTLIILIEYLKNIGEKYERNNTLINEMKRDGQLIKEEMMKMKFEQERVKIKDVIDTNCIEKHDLTKKDEQYLEELTKNNITIEYCQRNTPLHYENGLCISTLPKNKKELDIDKPRVMVYTNSMSIKELKFVKEKQQSVSEDLKEYVNNIKKNIQGFCQYMKENVDVIMSTGEIDPILEDMLQPIAIYANMKKNIIENIFNNKEKLKKISIVTIGGEKMTKIEKQEEIVTIIATKQRIEHIKYILSSMSKTNQYLQTPMLWMMPAVATGKLKNYENAMKKIVACYFQVKEMKEAEWQSLIKLYRSQDSKELTQKLLNKKGNSNYKNLYAFENVELFFNMMESFITHLVSIKYKISKQRVEMKRDEHTRQKLPTITSILKYRQMETTTVEKATLQTQHAQNENDPFYEAANSKERQYYGTPDEKWCILP